MTPTGAIVFLALILALIGGLAWLFAKASKRGEKYGKAQVTADEAAELLARAQAAQEAERDLETIQRDSGLSAVDRLRQSKAYRGE